MNNLENSHYKNYENVVKILFKNMPIHPLLRTF
jgi:hypothetical protein